MQAACSMNVRVNYRQLSVCPTYHGKVFGCSLKHLLLFLYMHRKAVSSEEALQNTSIQQKHTYQSSSSVFPQHSPSSSPLQCTTHKEDNFSFSTHILGIVATHTVQLHGYKLTVQTQWDVYHTPPHHITSGTHPSLFKCSCHSHFLLCLSMVLFSRL